MNAIWRKRLVLSGILASLALCLDLSQAAFYKYVDRNGQTRYVDDAGKIPPEYRQNLTTYKERDDHLTPEEREALRRSQRQTPAGAAPPVASPPGDASPSRSEHFTGSRNSDADTFETTVIIRGNQVLVPVTLNYEGNQVEALLLLDTGASMIALHEEVARGLRIRDTQQGTAQVVGGKNIPFKLATLSFVQVGPVRVNNLRAGIIRHRGGRSHFKGAAGNEFPSQRGLQHRLQTAGHHLAAVRAPAKTTPRPGCLFAGLRRCRPLPPGGVGPYRSSRRAAFSPQMASRAAWESPAAAISVK